MTSQLLHNHHVTVYVFGNPDIAIDSTALEVADSLTFEGVEWKYVKPNEDLPFIDLEHVVILDSVEGLTKVKLFNEESIESIRLSPRTSVHDFDLNFQLKYLKKLDKLNRITIIGIPMTKKVDYDSIQSILKKLVAQDIQGS